MSDAVFRTSASTEPVTPAAPTAIADIGDSVDTKIPDLLATYQDDQGKPYVAKYFDMENLWDAEPTMRYEMESIEGYMKDLISKGKLDNSVKAGDRFLKDLEKSAKISPYESTTNRINKLLAYIEFKKVVES